MKCLQDKNSICFCRVKHVKGRPDLLQNLNAENNVDAFVEVSQVPMIYLSAVREER